MLVAPAVSWRPAAKARRLPAAALPVSSARSITWCSTAHACSGSSWRTKAVERSARITDWCFSLPAPRRRAESWRAASAPVGSFKRSWQAPTKPPSCSLPKTPNIGSSAVTFDRWKSARSKEQPGLALLTNQRMCLGGKGRRPAGNNVTGAIGCPGGRLLGKVQPVLGIPVAGVDGQEALEHPGERLGPAFLDVAGGSDGLVVVAGGSRVVLLAGHVPGEPAQQRGRLRVSALHSSCWTRPRGACSRSSVICSSRSAAWESSEVGDATASCCFMRSKVRARRYATVGGRRCVGA